MYLFSYGSAKDMFRRDRLNETVFTGFFKIDKSSIFPILRHSKEEHSIEGFLILISEEELRAVDLFEDYPNLYNRILISIDGVQAWVYIENKKDNNAKK